MWGYKLSNKGMVLRWLLVIKVPGGGIQQVAEQKYTWGLYGRDRVEGIAQSDGHHLAPLNPKP